MTFARRWDEKSYTSYKAFAQRQPIDDLLWFGFAWSSGLLGNSGQGPYQMEWQMAFGGLAAMEFLLVLALVWKLSSQNFDSKRSRSYKVFAGLCTFSSFAFMSAFLGYNAWLWSSVGRLERYRVYVLLFLLKLMRMWALATFHFWVNRSAKGSESDQHEHFKYARHHSTLGLQTTSGCARKAFAVVQVLLWMVVYCLYTDYREVLQGLLQEAVLVVIACALAAIYYFIGCDSLMSCCVGWQCYYLRKAYAIGGCCFPFQCFECKKNCAGAIDFCCQDEPVDLEVQRQDDATSDIMVPESFIDGSGRWMSTALGVSLRRSLQEAVQQDLEAGQFGSEIAGDDPQAPRYFLSGQPTGFDLAAEDEVWTAHASQTFWPSCTAFADELAVCSHKIRLSPTASRDERVVGKILLLKVTDPTLYSNENGGGIYHYDGDVLPFCLWCPCCQLNRGKVFARHNYFLTECFAGNQATGVADAYIFKFGAAQKAGLEIAHTYRIIKPVALSASKLAEPKLLPPGQKNMDENVEAANSSP
jgi:hypothetical protein